MSNRHINRVEYLHTPIEELRKPSIVHRDVKSANILLDGDSRARLCDVGLARDVDVGTTMTQGSALGTPGYICPEYQETFEVMPHR
jgi:serine/threonine protein kinase